MTTAVPDTIPPSDIEPGPFRRDMLKLLATSGAAIGVGALAWPLIDSLNPSRDTLALATLELDIGSIAEGTGIVVLWRGAPLFVRHRTPAEIKEARDVDAATLRDPETDAARVRVGHEQWLVTSAVCTHLGCVPGGSKPSESRGEFGGWFCACHGSQYDTSGRIRKGPAPRNLPVPPYAFLTDTRIKIG